MKKAVVALIVILAGAALAEVSAKDKLVLTKYKSDTKKKCSVAIPGSTEQFKADSTCHAIINPGSGNVRYWQKVDLPAVPGYNTISVKRYRKMGCSTDIFFSERYTLNACKNNMMLTKK